MSLKEYKEKRNFAATPEPPGIVSTSKKPIFVVQYHNARKLHYDFRLEHNGCLISFAVPKGPSFNPKDKRLAVKVEDHPISYANFEGIIPKGEYGAGEVLIWDKGCFEALNNFKSGLKNGTLKFELFGKRLKGKWTLVRLKNDENNWLLIKEKDAFAKNSNGISKFKNSIISEKTFKNLQKNAKNPFKNINFQLATLKNKVPKEKDWLFEIKFDGYRIASFIENKSVKLITRNGNDFSKKFPEIVKSIEQFFSYSCVLDGEIVVLDSSGKSNFELLQDYTKIQDGQLVYMVFDILAKDGQDLRNISLLDRKEILKKLLKNSPKNIMYVDHIIGNGQKFYEEAKKLNLEGIIGKKIGSTYSGTRNDDWIKIKCYNLQEFIICGYTKSEKKTHFSSLLLGAFINNKLCYVGKVGTGFNIKNSKNIFEKMQKLKTNKNPFEDYKQEANTYFVAPKLIANIQFAEFTNDNILRQASFKGLREDKNFDEVFMGNQKNIKKMQKNIKKTSKNEEIIINNIKISSPNRIIFKDKNISKLDLINYYLCVSKRMLPFLENRLLSVVRCHDNVSEECFFKKHPQTKSKYIKTKKIVSSEGNKDDYFYITSAEGIIYEVQNGTVEFHTWGSKANNINSPDIMVFDLDPDKNMDIDKVRQGVLDLKKVLGKLGLKSFLKTSGGKGFHVVVPFSKTTNWEDFNDFAKKIAIIMEEKWPERYTSNVRKDKRKNKIFIDWLRNSKGATSVAPYSVRARKGAAASMPIAWKELNSVLPNEIDIITAQEKIKKSDPWKNFYSVNQKLK